MGKVLNIAGKDYTLEYGVEASLYEDCISSITGFLMNIGIAGSTEDIKRLLSGMANIPQTALTLFYAGLLEVHGSNGDKSVTSKNDAKALISQYFKEHKADDGGNFAEILKMCIEQMNEDNFFQLVGLDKLVGEENESENETLEK